MDAAAMPLPRDETTPPVTNMYLVAGILTSTISTMKVQRELLHVRDPRAYPRRAIRIRFQSRGHHSRSRSPATAPAARPARGDPPAARNRQAGNRADTHKDQYVCSDFSPHEESRTAKNK